MTAGAAYWPEVGRLDVWGAFGNEPGLSARGEADGVASDTKEWLRGASFAHGRAG